MFEATIKQVHTNVLQPASTVASTGTSSGSRFYLAPSEVKTLVQGFYQIAAFGGISLWDATYDAQNLICGKSYSYWVKKALSECYSGNFSPFPSACASSSSSSSIASSTSSVFSSSSSYVISTTSSTISSSSSVVSSSTSSHVSSSSSSYSAHPSSSYSAHPTTSKASTSSLSFPSHGPYTNSSTVSFSATKPGGGDSGPHQSNSNGGDHGSGPSSSIGGFPGSKASSSGADGGYWSHPKPTATKTSTCKCTFVGGIQGHPLTLVV
jgi:chitinase